MFYNLIFHTFSPKIDQKSGLDLVYTVIWHIFVKKWITFQKNYLFIIAMAGKTILEPPSTLWTKPFTVQPKLPLLIMKYDWHIDEQLNKHSDMQMPIEIQSCIFFPFMATNKNNTATILLLKPTKPQNPWATDVIQFEAWIRFIVALDSIFFIE